MKNGSNEPKRKKLFNPDSIADKLYAGIERDLGYPIGHRTNHSAFSFIRQAQGQSFLKKYLRESVDTKTLETTAYIKFLYINEHMDSHLKPVKPTYDRVTHFGKVDVLSNVLHRAKKLMHLTLGEFDEDDWFCECRNSAGSTIGVSFRDTSLEKKFSFPISTTERALPMFQRYLTFDKQLNDAMLDFNKATPLIGHYNVVQGARATTVDKTDTVSRMICVEPTVNMYLQQGLMHILYKKMRSVGLDVRTLPELHKKLAYESSITSSFSTIDWSSASDTVSLELLRWLLPPKWFYIVDLIRSDKAVIDGTLIKLNMVSTMGNAGTFPLETLVFWTFAMAVIAEDCSTNTVLPNWEDRFQCSVFGDDCIVPTRHAASFISCLTAVGFIINDDKSFYDTSAFRESCGGDFLHGVDVRPFSLRAPTSTRKSSLEPWLYIILNSLKTKYISYFGGISYLYDKHVFKTLFGLFKEYGLNLKIVPSFFPDDSGSSLTAII
jgi:hypothetical protein